MARLQAPTPTPIFSATRSPPPVEALMKVTQVKGPQVATSQNIYNLKVKPTQRLTKTDYLQSRHKLTQTQRDRQKKDKEGTVNSELPTLTLTVISIAVAAEEFVLNVR